MPSPNRRAAMGRVTGFHRWDDAAKMAGVAPAARPHHRELFARAVDGQHRTFQLVVFDVAGTTVLDGDSVVSSLQQALWYRGVDVLARDVFAVMGLSKPHAIAQLLVMHKEVSGEDLQRTVGLVHEDFRTIIKHRYRTEAAVAPAPRRLACVRLAATRRYPRRVGHRLQSGYLERRSGPRGMA